MAAVLALGLLSQSVFFATKRRNGLSKDMTFVLHVSGNATTFEDGVGAPFFSAFSFIPAANCIDRPNMLDRVCRIGTMV